MDGVVVEYDGVSGVRLMVVVGSITTEEPFASNAKERNRRFVVRHMLPIVSALLRSNAARVKPFDLSFSSTSATRKRVDTHHNVFAVRFCLR